MGILNGIWNWFGSWGVQLDGETETNLARRALLRQLGAVEQLANRIFVAIGFFIVIYSIAQAQGSLWPPKILADFVGIVGLLVGVMIASATLGGFLGFLFGIPRLLSHAGGPTGAPPAAANGNAGKPAGNPENEEKSESARAARRFFSSNTNLEEISDWITKIIVGLSLVQAGFIFEKIKKAAAVFKTNALPDAAGSDIMFVLVLVASLIAGFLFFYMETRTRITLLFADLENVADEGGPVVQQKVIDAVLSAPITANRGAPGTGDGSVRPAAPDPIEEDKKILKTDYADLKTSDQLAAWASAQARANNYQAAIRALQDAITLKPGDKDLLVRLADVQQRGGNARAAYFSISEAREKSKDDPDLLRRELLASLYLARPESFTKALEVAEKLKSVGGADDAWIQLWIACAYGQHYKWLSENNGGEDKKVKAKADAFAALQRVIQLEKKKPDGELRTFLRQLLDPNSKEVDDDDLRSFSGDPDFQQLANS